jgi:hypothetical protein
MWPVDGHIIEFCMFKGFVVIKHKYEHHVSLQTVSLAASKL